MNSQEFVTAIKSVVRDAAVRSSVELLEDPPGRRPADELVDRSKWYHSLPNEDRQRLVGIIESAVDSSIFGFLCVLDGVRAIEDGGKGHLELHFVRASSELLNDPDKVMLHDLY